MDVMVEMVNVNKMPANQALTKAFNMYSCGHGLFVGNGKVYTVSDGNKDCVSVGIEWMESRKYNRVCGIRSE